MAHCMLCHSACFGALPRAAACTTRPACPGTSRSPATLHACQIMDLLGSSLWDVWNKEGQQLSAQYVACVAVEALAILEALHVKG